jgi:FkbM family methyltransferase
VSSRSESKLAHPSDQSSTMVGAMKRVIRAVARKLGYDFRKIQEFTAPTLVDFLSTRRIDLVLDVGANVGQFASGLRHRGYRGGIVSFEPILSEFRVLEARAKRDRLWEARNVALGEKAGHASINVSEHTVFSSLLPQSAVGQRIGQASAVARVEQINVVRLDEIYEPFRDRRVFLKVDTQGYERQVVEGAASVLAYLKGIQLELPIVRLYEGMWRFDEAIAYMQARGFVVSQIAPSGHHPDDRVSLLDVDCVFRRAYAAEH